MSGLSCTACRCVSQWAQKTTDPLLLDCAKTEPSFTLMFTSPQTLQRIGNMQRKRQNRLCSWLRLIITVLNDVISVPRLPGWAEATASCRTELYVLTVLEQYHYTVHWHVAFKADWMVFESEAIFKTGKLQSWDIIYCPLKHVLQCVQYNELCKWYQCQPEEPWEGPLKYCF